MKIPLEPQQMQVWNQLLPLGFSSLSRLFTKTCETWPGAVTSISNQSITSLTDYGYTMAKSLILFGPNSNPNPK